VSEAAAGTGTNLRVLAGFAVRNLRGGLAGFGIFIACLAIGVGSIVAVTTLAQGLLDGLGREGRTILGGDISVGIIQRGASAEELRAFRQEGRVGSLVLLRAMSRAGENAALVEAKAVDSSWPMQGEAVLRGVGTVSEALAERGGRFGVLADPVLAERLGIHVGDTLRLGEATLELRGEIESEPDKLAAGLSLGPRLVLSQQALDRTGLIQPGSLVRYVYRILLPEGGNDDRALNASLGRIGGAFRDAGFEVRSRLNASPQLARNLDRFTQFLTLVGLTALLVGGVGIANATKAFVDRKRLTLAALKSVGATGGFVFALSLFEILALALAGIAIGLVIGTVLPMLAVKLGASLLPFPLEVGIDARSLALGLLYGLLTVATFAVWPLGRAHDIPVSTLFRDELGEDRSWPRWRYVIAVAIGALLLAAAAIAFAADRRIALIYVGAAAAAFLALRLVGMGIMRLAARAPHARSTALRMAVANLHKPGALTPSVILSLGLGITLIVALGLIEGSIRAQLGNGLPEKAPSFFFLDIPRQDSQAFAAFLQERAPGANVAQQPMMRGRIVALNGVPVSRIKADEQAAWVLEGDRGITYSETVPAGSVVDAGAWWAKDYTGEPLVSFGDDLARGLGLKLGDSVTVNVFGRAITARIASLRKIDWQSLGINFVMVFSPNTFRGAPHTDLATMTFAGETTPAEEAGIVRAVAERFPAVSTVRVKDTLDAIADLVGQLALALRGASGIALLSSALVLAGALAAGQRGRIHDAVILKTLGATRLRLLGVFLLEFAVLGAVTAAFGAVAGAAAAYYIVTRIMLLPFSLPLAGVAVAVLFALILTIGIGLAQTLRILGQKPAPYLRNL